MIRLEKFSYKYPTSEGQILSEISFSAAPGEFVVITGPTGAGKTTFCLAAAGILHHEFGGEIKGSVTFRGRDVLSYKDMGEIGTHLGFVFEDADSQLIFTTVEEEILSGLENRGLSQEEIKSRFEEIIRTTKISDLRSRAPHTLSGGQKQRVVIAAALAAGSECLILDEPTAELDTDATEIVLSVLKKMKEEGKTILLVEHKIDTLTSLADRVLVIRNGRIEEEKKPGEVRISEDIPDKGVDETNTAAAPPGDREAAIITENCSHHYSPTIPALNGVSLTIKKGEMTAIIGENGSGKTTLAKHFNGLLKPTGGTVTVLGRDTKDLSVTDLARHVGLVFQNPDTMLFAETVKEEVLFGLRNTGRGDDITTVESVLSEVGLSEKMERYPRSMSRGERQRLAIACVLAMMPEVIILDEPTTGLDEEEGDRILGILGKINAEGHTILMISHDMRIVRNHAQRIIVMEKGTIISDTANGVK